MLRCSQKCDTNNAIRETTMETSEDKKLITIKRYSNRKLYDTSQSRYITLTELGELIRRGENVEVIDNETKADLTEMTLAQVLIAQKKQKQNGLRNLVQSQAEILLQRLSVPVQQIRDEAIRQVEKQVENLKRITGAVESSPSESVEKPDDETKSNEEKPVENTGKSKIDRPITSILSKLDSLKASSDEKLLSYLLVQRIEELESEVADLRKRLELLEQKNDENN